VHIEGEEAEEGSTGDREVDLEDKAPGEVLGEDHF
jgi:hypothetical protein